MSACSPHSAAVMAWVSAYLREGVAVGLGLGVRVRVRVRVMVRVRGCVVGSILGVEG